MKDDLAVLGPEERAAFLEEEETTALSASSSGSFSPDTTAYPSTLLHPSKRIDVDVHPVRTSAVLSESMAVPRSLGHADLESYTVPLAPPARSSLPASGNLAVLAEDEPPQQPQHDQQESPSNIFDEDPLYLEEEEDEEESAEPGSTRPHDDWRTEQASMDYEQRVQLGSSAILHHRRLPSTIYEEGTSSSQMDQMQRVVEETSNLSSSPKGLRRTKPLSWDNLVSMDKKDEPVITFGLKSAQDEKKKPFEPIFLSTRAFQALSSRLLVKHYSPVASATWIGFWALLHVTCANYVLTPLRDAIALQVGVKNIPILTLVSTVLAFCSSVPIGWLFEAPDPGRRRLWKRMGLTRGETQGTSLALFYRCFGLVLLSYAVGFGLLEFFQSAEAPTSDASDMAPLRWWQDFGVLWSKLGKVLYVAFFLVVHLMKLHSLSLMWGVTTEAMEYEEVARKKSQMESNKTRLQRLALVGFGGTLGGILGSGMASSMAHLLRLPGLLVLAALLLEVSAELSIELGRIMQKHWEEQQLFQSSNDLASLDTSMKRSSSLGSMKRVASGNSLNRVKSATDLSGKAQAAAAAAPVAEPVNDNTFFQRLKRGVTTILRSRLLMSIFTYNALYASTTVLLSFQRAELVANRNTDNDTGSTAEADTAFLAKVNMASSVAVFALQASGLGAYVAHACGPRGTLSLMPLIRLAGVLALAWWHHVSNGQSPNLLIFLVVDECTKIMNLAVAKPVRESLWRGLSNEARYEAKPIVDTLANRWGGGSAAFLVSFIQRTLGLLGVAAGADGVRKVFGFPPTLFLCMVIATWWTAISADLGQIRRKIDLELKKQQ